MVSSRRTTAALFIGLAAVWGLSFVAARAALTDVSPVLLAAFRFDIAALVLLGYAVATTSDWFPSDLREWATVIVGGVFSIALHHALLFTGQQHVTSAVAAVVVCLDPILAAVFARFLLPQERLSRTDAVGLLLGAIGVGIIARVSPDTLLQTDSFGVALVLLAAAAFAFGAVGTQRLRSTLPVQSMIAWMTAIGAPILHATAIVLPGERLTAVTWSWTALAGLTYLAVIAAGVGYVLYFALLDRVGAIEINLVAYATPVFAAVGGWLVLGERIRPHTVVGFGVIILAFTIIKRREIRAELRRVKS